MLYFIFCNFRNFSGLNFGVLSNGNRTYQANEPRRLNQVSTDGLICLGDSGVSPIDMSCTLTRTDIFGIPYLPVIKGVRNFLHKILTSGSKILTSGFVLDLEAQDEFDGNFSCRMKLRCSTLYFSTSETPLELRYLAQNPM